MTTAAPDRAVPARAATRRSARRRLACLGLAGAMLAAAATGASADDGGLGGFLTSIFGGAPQQAAAPGPALRSAPASAQRYETVPVYRRARPRPLTVRLRTARPKLLIAAAGPTKPGKVSIYEDRTLRRGDAVMTADGVRVFAGSASWPYRSGDFVKLKDAGMDRDASKVLAQLDKLPRG